MIEKLVEALDKIGLGLPPEGAHRDRVLAVVEGDPKLLDGKELRRRHTKVWGFREAGRHLGISWKMAQKLAREGVLPTLPREEWVMGPVTMHRRHYVDDILGRTYSHTTEEVKMVPLVFDASAIKKITPADLQAMLNPEDEGDE